MSWAALEIELTVPNVLWQPQQWTSCSGATVQQSTIFNMKNAKMSPWSGLSILAGWGSWGKVNSKNQIRRRIHRGVWDSSSHFMLFVLERKVLVELVGAPIKLWAHSFPHSTCLCLRFASGEWRPEVIKESWDTAGNISFHECLKKCNICTPEERISCPQVGREI